MPSITKPASGNWRAQVRRKGCYAAAPFRRRRDTEEWAFDTEGCIDHGKRRAQRGAGPATLAIDFSFIRTLLSHAAAVHSIDVATEDVRLARIALCRLGLIGKGNERDRRPTPDELDELIERFESNPRQLIPMGRIIRFTVATAMRQERPARSNGPM